MDKRKKLGIRGEEFAEHLLKKNGYTILEKNYRCRLGELDIIAMDKKVLAFIEVRTKSSLKYGSPSQSITLKKMGKIKKLAEYFILTNNIKNTDCRFDVVAIITHDQQMDGELIKNAFIF